MTRTEKAKYNDNKQIVTELLPLHENRKSYYGKAKVIFNPDGSIELLSYCTIVGKIENGTFTRLWSGNSRTTNRHIHEFRLQFDKDYRKAV